ncbi:unnamed protein product [Closterium sp. Naga37s-1]|nr:unnamed protein product [Closterium sp. Naga37s-1]
MGGVGGRGCGMGGAGAAGMAGRGDADDYGGDGRVGGGALGGGMGGSGMGGSGMGGSGMGGSGMGGSGMGGLGMGGSGMGGSGMGSSGMGAAGMGSAGMGGAGMGGSGMEGAGMGGSGMGAAGMDGGPFQRSGSFGESGDADVMEGGRVGRGVGRSRSGRVRGRPAWRGWRGWEQERVWKQGTALGVVGLVGLAEVAGVGSGWVDVQAPTLLYNLVFGESLVNDAVSIVLFRTLCLLHTLSSLSVLASPARGRRAGTKRCSTTCVPERALSTTPSLSCSSAPFASFTNQEFSMASIATAIELKFASFTNQEFSIASIATAIASFSKFELSLVLVSGYLSYSVAEMLSLSGIMALFFCGICNAHYGAEAAKFELSLVLVSGYLSYSVAEMLSLSGIMALFFCTTTSSHASKISSKYAFEALSFMAEMFVFAYLACSRIFSESLSFMAEMFVFADLDMQVCHSSYHVYPHPYLRHVSHHLSPRQVVVMQHVIDWGLLLSAIPLIPSLSPSLSAIPLTPSLSPSLSAIPLIPSLSPSLSAIPLIPSPSPSFSAIPLIPSLSPSLSAMSHTISIPVPLCHVSHHLYPRPSLPCLTPSLALPGGGDAACDRLGSTSLCHSSLPPFSSLQRLPSLLPLQLHAGQQDPHQHDSNDVPQRAKGRHCLCPRPSTCHRSSLPLCLPAFPYPPRANKIPTNMILMMWLSGLRGAIAFALALNMPQRNPAIISTTLFVVVLTTVVMGGSTCPLLRALGLSAAHPHTPKHARASLAGNWVEQLPSAFEDHVLVKFSDPDVTIDGDPVAELDVICFSVRPSGISSLTEFGDPMNFLLTEWDDICPELAAGVSASSKVGSSGGDTSKAGGAGTSKPLAQEENGSPHLPVRKTPL